MKLDNLDRELLNAEGTPLRDGEKALTLRFALGMVANWMDPENKDLGQKYKLGMIAVKLAKAQKNLTLSAEDVTLMKDRINRMFSPIAVLRLHDILEGNKSAELRVAKEIDEDEEPKEAKA